MATKPTFIVGIDLSFRNTGLAVISGSTPLTTPITLKTLKTTSKMDDIEACDYLTNQLQLFLLQLAQKGRHLRISVEFPAHTAHLGGARSAYLAGCAVACLAPSLTLYPDYTIQHQRAIANLVEYPKGLKRAEKKRRNIQKAAGLYPNAPFSTAKEGGILDSEEHVADALLLAHLARSDLDT